MNGSVLKKTKLKTKFNEGNNKNLMPRKLFYGEEDFKGPINLSGTSLTTNGLFPRVNF